MTGSFSVKFVGLFVVILVGFRAIAELWEILGDLSYPVVNDSVSISYFVIIHHNEELFRTNPLRKSIFLK